jgi:serine/threonine protein kinase
MGVVYLCKDLRHERLVAIKKLTPTAGDVAQARALLIGEAKSLAKLNHQNIVKVWELSDDPDDSFIVMEYLEGGSLADRLARTGSLPLKRAYAILRQVCDGLQYAHERGVLHRDVKPSNILFSEENTAKLSDFGLAFRITAMGPDVSVPVGGSRGYMPPEQELGSENLDQRVDVHGLGATLSRMLTGDLHGSTEMGALSEDVKDFLTRATAPESRDRIPTVTAFLNELAALVDSSSPTRSSPSVSSEDSAESKAPTSVDDILAFRSIISHLVDVDFFIDANPPEPNWDRDKIALAINAVNYEKEQHRYREASKHASLELERLASRRDDAERDLHRLEALARRKRLGSPPTKPLRMFSSSSDDFRVEQQVFQQRIADYRIAQKEYEDILDNVNDARRCHNDARKLYDQVKQDIALQRARCEIDVSKALDFDILEFMRSLLRLTKQSVHHEGNYFQGFVLLLFAGKTYSLLHEDLTESDVTVQRPGSATGSGAALRPARRSAITPAR